MGLDLKTIEPLVPNGPKANFGDTSYAGGQFMKLYGRSFAIMANKQKEAERKAIQDTICELQDLWGKLKNRSTDWWKDENGWQRIVYEDNPIYNVQEGPKYLFNGQVYPESTFFSFP